ncbi:MAG: hypothetical protein L6R36_008500 [Xanthoria steineri]|nr:MAG: hypothetical protein L6R36_008500 [Xanthoria steineri]
MQRTILIYLLYLLAHYTHQSSAAISRDTSTSGNYIINNCRHVNHTTDLDHLLHRFRHAFHYILADLDKGTSSPHGFRAFFKSNTNLRLAKQVFQAIARGQNLTVGATTKPPVLECASPAFRTGVYQEVYRMVCTPAGRKPSHAAGLPLDGTVILCPEFWKEERDFPGEEDCPVVEGRRRNRKFMDSGWGLRDTKFAILVHELVHLYNPLDAAAKTAEKYRAQDCVDLGVQESVGNAENWALYAASAAARCTKFPISPAPEELRI